MGTSWQGPLLGLPTHHAVRLQVVTLLLHQHRSQEALAHFQQHVSSYRHPPSQLAPVPLAVVGAQHGWVGRQYQVMGELMSSRVDPAHLPPQVLATPCKEILTHWEGVFVAVPPADLSTWHVLWVNDT